jgi:hypothetical protein
MNKSAQEIREDINWMGQLAEIYSVADYQFVRYFNRDVKTSKITDEEMYTSYYKGQRQSRSYYTLEACMAGSMAIVHDGLNSQAGTMFVRMLKLEKDA